VYDDFNNFFLCSVSAGKLKVDKPTLLVMGNEGRGMCF
jgi:hypothetical protein